MISKSCPELKILFWVGFGKFFIFILFSFFDFDGVVEWLESENGLHWLETNVWMRVKLLKVEDWRGVQHHWNAGNHGLDRNLWWSCQRKLR